MKKQKPWIENNIKKLRSIKNKFYKKYLKNPTKENFEIFKCHFRIYNKEKSKSKREYYKTLLENNKHDSKRTWSIMNKLLKGSKGEEQSVVTVNGEQITNPEECLNNHFINVGKLISNNFPTTNNYKKYCGQSNMNSLFLQPVSAIEIINATNSLKRKSSSGCDNIPTSVVMSTIGSIIDVVTFLVNKIFENGVFPQCLKKAKVVPLQKIKNSNDVTNFRPISMLPAFSKIIEKVIQRRLIKFIEDNQILSTKQFGFRPKYSTELAITKLTYHVGKMAEQKKFTAGVCLDLTKAFDCIDHLILLDKLEHYGIRGKCLKMIESYLSDRFQYTIVNGVRSSCRGLNVGVPQGSI